MLVLARKKGESIVIGENIEISIVDIQGDTVRIGINAPKEVSIYRQELYEEIKRANQEATKAVSHIADNLNRLKGFGRKND